MNNLQLSKTIPECSSSQCCKVFALHDMLFSGQDSSSEETSEEVHTAQQQATRPVHLDLFTLLRTTHLYLGPFSSPSLPRCYGLYSNACPSTGTLTKACRINTSPEDLHVTDDTTGWS